MLRLCLIYKFCETWHVHVIYYTYHLSTHTFFFFFQLYEKLKLMTASKFCKHTSSDDGSTDEDGSIIEDDPPVSLISYATYNYTCKD